MNFFKITSLWMFVVIEEIWSRKFSSSGLGVSTISFGLGFKDEQLKIKYGIFRLGTEKVVIFLRDGNLMNLGNLVFRVWELKRMESIGEDKK